MTDELTIKTEKELSNKELKLEEVDKHIQSIFNESESFIDNFYNKAIYYQRGDKVLLRYTIEKEKYIYLISLEIIPSRTERLLKDISVKLEGAYRYRNYAHPSWYIDC